MEKNRMKKQGLMFALIGLALGGGVSSHAPLAYAQESGQARVSEQLVKTLVLDPVALGLDKSQAAGIKARAATKAEYDAAGLPFDGKLSKLRIERVLRDDGRVEVRVFSSEAVSGMSALMRLDSPMGQMFREERLGGTAESVQKSATRQQEAEAKPKERKLVVKKKESSKEPREQQTTKRKGRLTPGEAYVVSSGDTLRGIAARAAGTTDKDEVFRWQHGIWLSNLAAFVKGNPERIMLGEKLVIPAVDSLASAEVAKKEMLNGERTGKPPFGASVASQSNTKTPKEEMVLPMPKIREDSKKPSNKDVWDPAAEAEVLMSEGKESSKADATKYEKQPEKNQESSHKDKELEAALLEAKKAREELAEMRRMMDEMKSSAQKKTTDVFVEESSAKIEEKPSETNKSTSTGDGVPPEEKTAAVEEKAQQEPPKEKQKKAPPKKAPPPPTPKEEAVKEAGLPLYVMAGGGVALAVLLGGGLAVYRAKKKRRSLDTDETDMGPLSIPTSPIFQPTAVVKFDASEEELEALTEFAEEEKKKEALAPILPPAAPPPSKEEVDKAWEARSDIQIPSSSTKALEDLGAIVAQVVDSRVATQEPRSGMDDEAMDFDMNLDYKPDPDAPLLPDDNMPSTTLNFDMPSDLPESLSLDQPTQSQAPSSGGEQAVSTMLDLAQAYWEIGDRSGAEELLQEILAKGDQMQKTQALELMGRFGSTE